VSLVILAKNPITHQGMLLVEQNVFDALDGFRQRDVTAPESGGILLGLRRGPHLHVVDMTVPQPGDAQHRTAFHRRSEAHQKIALARWSASAARLDYVGEWHTHPEINPTPSSIDRREWRAILASRAAPMVFLILGTQGGAWLGMGSGTQLLQAAVA
jgi:integrative and conjugative element protein (TIGR02256 family)